MKKEFQFGIDEPTPQKAGRKLFRKIGYDSYKWRFEIRKINKIKEDKFMSDQIRTGKVRFSYCNVFEPRSIEGQDARYSVTLLIPKSDTETINKINAGIKAAIEEGNSKVFGSVVQKPKIPIYDGDGLRPSGEAFGEECKGCYVLTANSTQQPGIVDRKLNHIIDPREFYSGCYGIATLRFFPYNKNGNKGIGCGLGNLLKLEDGEALGGRTRAEDDFADMRETADIDPITGEPTMASILGL